MKRINSMTALKKIISRQPGSFVRWSRGPAMDARQGRSRDGQSGEAHAGLSAVSINPEWVTDEAWMARRVTEYRFLRLKDPRIGCHIYAGQVVGEDSDGYESISSIVHIGTLSNALISKLVEIKG